MLSHSLTLYLKARADILEKTLIMIDSFQFRMNTLMMPMNEIIHTISEDRTYEELTYLKQCDIYLKQGIDFPIAWRNSVEDVCFKLKAEEISKLVAFGECLGKADAENQKITLSMFREYFSDRFKAAVNEKKKYSNPILLTGFLSGCAIFIMLI